MAGFFISGSIKGSKTKRCNMEMRKDVKAAFNKIILHLARPGNRDKEFPFDTLLQSLEIPEIHKSTLWHSIWNHYPKIVTTSKPSISNVPIKINEIGIELATELEDEIHQEQIKLYPVYCDKILRLITIKDKENITLTTPEISSILKIDYHTCEAIADDFNQRGLITLSVTSGEYNWHVLSPGHTFVRKTSFQNENESGIANFHYEDNSIDNSISTHGPNSPVASNLSTLTQTINEPKHIEKKHWLQRAFEWVWEQIKKPVVAGIGSFIIGFISGRTTSTDSKLNNQQDSLSRSRSDSTKPLKDTPYKKF